jgi:hypothetical protein
MKRITVVLAAAAVAAALVGASAVPAAAQDLDRNGFFANHDGFFVGDHRFGNLFDNIGVPFSSGSGQETDATGNVDLSLGVGSSGDNSNQCVARMQFGNTGNLQKAQGFARSDSFADDVEFDGGSFHFVPEQVVSCEQTVEQAATVNGR